MRYIPKKDNTLNLMRFLINEELRNFHIKEIDNRYPVNSKDFKSREDIVKNRIAERIVYWHQFLTKSINYIVQTPTKDVLNTRLKIIKETPDCTENMYNTFVECLQALLENHYNLGSSEAFIELVNKNPVKNNEVLTFKWQKQDSQLKGLFNQLQANTLIDKDCSLETFKNTLNGGLLSEIKPIEYKCSKSLQVYLYDMLNFGGFISFNITHNKIIEKITGVRGVAQVRNNYNENKSEKPKRSEIIDKIVESL